MSKGPQFKIGARLQISRELLGWYGLDIKPQGPQQEQIDFAVRHGPASVGKALHQLQRL
jgi:hypothetical protein